MPTWEVVGGVGKGGILVRTERSLNAPKDTQRLSTGAIVKQLDTEGDRLQYLLLSGDGPSTGWVAVALQDKELLKKRPGPDLDFREGGFGYGKTLAIHCQECFEEAMDVMWHVSDGSGPPARTPLESPDKISGDAPLEVFSPSTPGQHAARIEMVLDKDGGKPTEDEDDLQPPPGSFVKRFDCGKETRTTVHNMPTGRTFLLSVVIEVEDRGWLRSRWIRLSTLTAESRKPDLYNVDPFDNVRGKCKLCYCQEFVPASSWSLSSQKSIRCRKCGCAADNHEISKDPAKKVSASKEDKLPVQGAEVWILALGTRGDQQPYVALGLALQQAGYKVRLFGAAPLQRFAATKGLDVTVAGKDWEEYGMELHEAALKPDYVCEWWEMPFHEMWKTSDDFMGRGVHKWMMHELPEAVKTVLLELKNQDKHPDLFIYNHLGVNAGVTAWKKWGIRSVMAGLGTEPFSVTEGRTFGKKEFDLVDRRGVAPVIREMFLLRMTLERFNNLYLEPDKLFGTSPMIKKLFTNDQLLYAKDWHYTGFWILAKDSQVDDATMFGGKDVMEKIERFVADKRPPVYMGWGSMTKVPGKHMLLVGIGALKALGLRGIVSRGWAKLSMDKLREAVGDEDPDKLCEYAEANVLFIDKAPHEWLFPRCVCTVHHGGAGTTAASLRAGVPTVITPIVYDQFEHARWVNQLGNGIGLGDLEKVEMQDLEAALQKVTSSGECSDAAKEVQRLILAEDGAQGAVDAVTLIIRDQVRNGWAKKKWEVEKEQDKVDHDKWVKEETERRKQRMRQGQALQDPESRKLVMLREDGKWLVWNACWFGANNELHENHSGPAAEEYQEKAHEDGVRVAKHVEVLEKEKALPLPAIEHVRDQAEAAGRVAARFVLEGQALPQEEVRLMSPPLEMAQELWINMVKAIKLAAQAVAEGCLDAKLLRKGDERWSISGENWHLCEHNLKSKELQIKFEAEWAEKVAPET